MLRCSQCGEITGAEMRACPYCGADFAAYKPDQFTPPAPRKPSRLNLLWIAPASLIILTITVLTVVGRINRTAGLALLLLAAVNLLAAAVMNWTQRKSETDGVWHYRFPTL